MNEYDKRYTQIWVTDWIFYTVQSEADIYNGVAIKEFIVTDVVCKKIPTQFVINEGMCYARATKELSITTLKTLQDDNKTGLKKFKIIYKKYISNVNN